MKVYIVHGLNSALDKHWFAYLVGELAKRNISCFCLPMPNPTAPKAEEWLEFLKKEIHMDDQTVLIGHSVGCVSVLTYLANTGAKALGTILVSGFDEPLKSLTPSSHYTRHSPLSHHWKTPMYLLPWMTKAFLTR